MQTAKKGSEENIMGLACIARPVFAGERLARGAFGAEVGVSPRSPLTLVSLERVHMSPSLEQPQSCQE